MCGRKTLTQGKLEIIEELSVDDWSGDFEPSYNIAPTQTVPVLRRLNNKNVIRTMKWGLIPSWSKDMSFASKMINARCETITVKPIWRQLIPQQRGIAVASGYFEWKKSAAGKIPHYIHREDGKLLLMAALWDVWKSPDKKVILSYSVITCSASHRLEHIHERMPVFIGQHQISVWLDSVHYSQSKALALLVPNDEGLINHPVSTLVNNVKNNSPECIKPAQQ